jgi:hypothetical protein
MDFINASLPNLMFIAGLLALGIGLGIEFKVIEIKGELSKNARIGACALGGFLILTSIFFYARPLLTASAPTAVAQPTAVQAAIGIAAPGQGQLADPSVVAAAASPSMPATHTTVPPSATPEPTATPIPASATPEPTATPIPPTLTPEPSVTPEPIVSGVAVPDIRGQEPKDARKVLEPLGLQLEEKKGKCADIGVSDDEVRKVKKGRISCQAPLPGSLVSVETHIVYVLAD